MGSSLTFFVSTQANAPMIEIEHRSTSALKKKCMDIVVKNLRKKQEDNREKLCPLDILQSSSFIQPPFDSAQKLISSYASCDIDLDPLTSALWHLERKVEVISVEGYLFQCKASLPSDFPVLPPEGRREEAKEEEKEQSLVRS